MELNGVSCEIGDVPNQYFIGLSKKMLILGR